MYLINVFFFLQGSFSLIGPSLAHSDGRCKSYIEIKPRVACEAKVLNCLANKYISLKFVGGG